jgi:hypothetical protein
VDQTGASRARSAATTLSVASVSPDTGALATTVDVHIFGHGFSDGAAARWALDGVPDSNQVKTNSTRFVSSTELVANITISGSATATTWDVEVTSRGKTGVGTESVIAPDAFTVVDPTATFYFPLADQSLSLKSDGLYSDGTSSVYADGVCGVGTHIFATTLASNSGDATLTTPRLGNARTKCAVGPRRITLRYEDGVVETPTFFNIHGISNTTYGIPLGSDPVPRHFAINPTVRCDALRWGALGDSVLVTRLDPSSWLVESRPYPNDRAYCVKTGQYFHMPIRFIVTSSRPLR